MNLWDPALATSANEQCLNKTAAIFSNQYASQRFNLSTDDNPDSLDVLHYFGDLIQKIGSEDLQELSKHKFHENVTSETIEEFIEKCNQLEEMSFIDARRSMVDQLKTSIGELFTIDAKLQSKRFRLECNESSASKFATTGVVIFLIVIHICRALFN